MVCETHFRTFMQKVQADSFFENLSERRIIYDFDKYGDSPSCLEERDNIDDTAAITQGFGITEAGKIPNKNLETNVTIISNQECYDLLSKVPFPTHKTTIKSTLFDGVTDQVVCTKGFLENGVVTVSSKSFDKYQSVSKINSIILSKLMKFSRVLAMETVEVLYT